MTLSEMQTERTALLKRITSLRSRVSFGDRTVQYDLTTAEKALNLLDREIASARIAEGATVSRVVRLTGRSGY